MAPNIFQKLKFDLNPSQYLNLTTDKNLLPFNKEHQNDRGIRVMIRTRESIFFWFLVIGHIFYTHNIKAFDTQDYMVYELWVHTKKGVITLCVRTLKNNSFSEK